MVTEEGIMTGDCSVVSMASLSLILEVSNSVLIPCFIQIPGTTKYTSCGSCLITVLFSAYFVLVFLFSLLCF